jgi:hypothetical protein
MSKRTLTDDDVPQIVELANGHLEDAENVLWTTSERMTDEETAAELEEVVHQIWDVQHRLLDIQRNVP